MKFLRTSFCIVFCWLVYILPNNQWYSLLEGIEVFQRIGKPTSKTQNTIVRFLNRKNYEKVLANKKKLNNEKHNFHAGTNIFVNKNLTPMNETIAYNCRKLRRSGLIHGCFSKNFIVYIKENETSRPINVFHLGKLISLFPDHFQNNDENDQYHHVSIDANRSMQSSY